MRSSKTGLRTQISLVVLGDALNFSVNFIATMVLARLLSVESMGTYRQAIYLLSLVVSLLEAGLAATAYRFWTMLNDLARVAYTKMVVGVLVGMGLLGGVAIWALSAPISVWYNNPDLSHVLVGVCLFPLSAIPVMLLRPVLISQGYPLRAILLEIVFVFLYVFSLIIPLWLGSDLAEALRVWIVACTLRLLFIPIVLKPYLFDRHQWWSSEILHTVWAYLWPIQVGRLLGYLTAYLDKIVASLFLTTTGFAIYSTGAREIPFIGMVGFSMANVLVPHLVFDVESGNLQQVARRWSLACERSAVLTYLVAAFCIWYAMPVMQFLFSAKYAESSAPFRVFAAMTFIRVIEYASLAKAFGRTDLILRSSIVGALAIATWIIPLAKIFGPSGLGSAFLVSTICQAAYLLINYRKLLKMPITGFFPLGRLITIMLIAFASVSISGIILSRFLNMSDNTMMAVLAWKLSVAFAVSMVLYASVIILLGFVHVPRLDLIRAHITQSTIWNKIRVQR